MASAQSSNQNVYAITKEGDDFIPETAKWTCKYGPTMAQCGWINNDIKIKRCVQCNAIRSDAVAHIGERLDEGAKGRCWQICEIKDDGTEVWTYDFRRERNESWASFENTMAPVTAIRGDHTMWQCMTIVNDEYCQVNAMFEFSQDDRGCAIRVPILGCPKCKLARRVGTLALRDSWEIIGHLKDYTTLGEEVWEYDAPYDVDEPDQVLYRTVAGFGNGDIAYYGAND
ncbi:hypothetical protein F52700_7988 [Fusarium sp. NRRL 52700]|nr:hypothetical protein F52700_7988 [Fusarium sp. NRRL 52700]